MIKPGEEWGTPASAPPDVEGSGDDADLAAIVAERGDVLVRFLPSPACDLARAVGLDGARTPTTEVAVDALAAGGTVACNMVVLGTPPDRLRGLSRGAVVDVTVDGKRWFAGNATTIVVATGEFLRGLDIVPRGHPGDGRAEVQTYSVARRERGPLRARLAAGAHLPHAAIKQRSAHRVEIHAVRPIRLEVDGHSQGRVRHLTVEVLPQAYRLLV